MPGAWRGSCPASRHCHCPQRRDGCAAWAYLDCGAGGAPALVQFLACFNSCCHPPTSRAVGREYSVGSGFGIGRESRLLVCRQLPSCSGPRVPALPGDVALPPTSGPDHHPLPELLLMMAASAQAGWQQGSHATGTVGTHGGGRAESRHGEEEEQEQRSRVNDNDVVIST